MRWEDSVLGLLEDLEQQAAGLHQAERDAEVAGLSVAEYADIDLCSRLHASVGAELRLRLLGGRMLSGLLTRVGTDFLLLERPGQQWLVRLPAVSRLGGVAVGSVSREALPLSARLGVRSVLRRIADAGGECQLVFSDDSVLEGRIGRVGADFLELRSPTGSAQGDDVVPLESVAAVLGRA